MDDPDSLNKEGVSSKARADGMHCPNSGDACCSLVGHRDAEIRCHNDRLRRFSSLSRHLASRTEGVACNVVDDGRHRRLLCRGSVACMMSADVSWSMA